MTHTEQGEIAVANSAGISNVQNMKVTIRPYRGTASIYSDPSIDAPLHIYGFSYIRLNASTKNLWNDDWYKEANWYYRDSGAFEGYYQGNARTFMLNHFGTNSHGVFHHPMNLGRVRISFDFFRNASSGTIQVRFRYKGDSAYTNHSGNISSSGHKSYVSDANKDCVAVSFYTSAGTSAASFAIKNLQIELGADETEYEKGKSQEIHVILPKGKNIFNISEMWLSAYAISSTGSEASSSNYKCTASYIPIEPNKTYTLQYNKGTSTSLGHSVALYDKDKNFISRSGSSASTATGLMTFQFTTTEDTRFIRFNVPNTNTTNIQIEEGSTATDYEPCKPVYGGVLDLITGQLTVTHELLELDGVTSGKKMESKGSATTNDTYYMALSNASLYGTAKSNTVTAEKMAEYGLQFSHGIRYNAETIDTVRLAFTAYIGAATVFQPRMCFALSEGIDTVEKCNQWIKDQYDAGTPVQFWYKLKTDRTYQLDPQQMSMLAGKNHIWTNMYGANVEATYEISDMLSRKRMFANTYRPNLYSANGQFASFSTNMTSPMKHCLASFGPVQNGSEDPLPTNIRPITGRADLVITRTGVNLFGGRLLRDGILNALTGTTVTFDDENRKVRYASTATVITNFTQLCGLSEHFKKNTRYTFFMTIYKSSITSPNMQVVYTDGTIVGLPSVSAVTTKETIRYASDASKTIKALSKRNSGGYTTVYYDECGVFEGDVTMAEFQAYLAARDTIPGTTVPVSWENEVGGIYGGTVDLTTGVLSVTRYVESTEALKNRTWYAANSGTGSDARPYIRARNTTMMEEGKTDLICSHFPYAGTGTTIYANQVKNMVSDYYNICFCAPDLFTTVAEFKAWLDNQEILGTPVQLVMYRATPLTYQLTPQQLNAIKGQNNVWNSGGGDTSVQYWKHG